MNPLDISAYIKVTTQFQNHATKRDRIHFLILDSFHLLKVGIINQRSNIQSTSYTTMFVIPNVDQNYQCHFCRGRFLCTQQVWKFVCSSSACVRSVEHSASFIFVSVDSMVLFNHFLRLNAWFITCIDTLIIKFWKLYAAEFEFDFSTASQR